jgi:hypothetical protein
MKHPFAKLTIEGIWSINILECSMCQIAKELKVFALASSNLHYLGIIIIR